tara:strand:+ start:571 stop:825 length:255 start_codon:yes stop_codon:yes gene_type:complete
MANTIADIALSIITLSDHFTGNFSRKYTCGNSNNAVASEHGHGGYNLPYHGLWRDIPITYRGYSHNSPINAARDASKPIIGAFY